MIDPQLIIGATLLPLFVAYLIYVKDKYLKDDGINILLSFLLGCFIIIPVLIMQLLFDKYFTNNEYLINYVQAGLIEEGFKFIILYQFKNKISDSYDGIKYAIMISLGFAMIENIGYSFKGENLGVGGFEIIVLRMFTAIPMHFINGVCMGFLISCGLAKNSTVYLSKIYFVLSLAVPVILHGSYDYYISTSFYGILVLLISIVLNYYPLRLFLTKN
jgi:RsiW-degrading membrane proteinase PrsW (M82 family)